MDHWGIKLVFVLLSLLNAYFWWQEYRQSPEQLTPRGRSARRLTFIFAAVAIYLSYML